MNARELILSVFDNPNQYTEKVDAPHHKIIGKVCDIEIEGMYTEGRNNAIIVPWYIVEKAWDIVIKRIQSSGYNYMRLKDKFGVMVTNIK